MPIIHDTRKYVRDDRGEIVLRTLAIPFKPEYLLVAQDRTGPLVPLNQVTTPLPLCGFRFDLSDAAKALIIAQDPNMHPRGGFSDAKVEFSFDAMQDQIAMLRVTRAVREGDPAP